MNRTDQADEAFKAAMRAEWDEAAAGWDAHGPAIHDWLRGPTEAMLSMAGVVRGARVLDVAAGTGDQTLAIAERVGPSGYVLATDLSPAILSLARGHAERAGGARVETRVADGESLGVPEASFDAAICRLGLMFFADPLRGLCEIARALRPGGGLCTLVFSRPEANPCLTILMSTALRHAGLPPPDPYRPGGLMSLGRPGHIDALFHEAGFRDIATTAVDAVFRLPSVDDYLGFVRQSAAPVMQILARLDAAAAKAAWAETRERLRVFDTASGWAGPNELLLTAGRRPTQAP
jgi:SAM-dependent methyltransferase